MAVNGAIADETGKDAQGQLTTHCCLPAGGICSNATDRFLLKAAIYQYRSTLVRRVATDKDHISPAADNQ